MNRRDFVRLGTLATGTMVGTGKMIASTPLTPLRVVQLGVAHSHAAAKWATAKKYPELFALEGIWEPDSAERAEAQSRPEYAGVRWLEDGDVFNNPRVQVALVQTELPDLIATGRRALKAGWHVHLDKPPGRTLEELQELQGLAADRGRVLQIGYMWRYHPAFRFCYDAVREGWIGRVFAVHGEMGSDLSPDRRPWLAQHYGGSTLLLGCHLIDLAIGIMGPPSGITTRKRKTFSQRDRYSDHEIAILEYPDGMAVVRSINAEVGAGSRRQFVICGENGTIEVMPIEPAKVRLTLRKAAGQFKAGAQPVDLPAVTGRYDEMMMDFARIVRGERSIVPHFDAVHEREVHRAVLACADAR